MLDITTTTSPSSTTATTDGSTEIVSSTASPLTEDDVDELQAKWGTAITDISTAFLANGDYMAIANAAAAELYGFGHSKVLFKPTKAAEVPFRPTGTDGMSYFVGGAAVGLTSGGHSEDKGFATNGGKGWSKVVFKNHDIELLGPVAISMGHYIFTCATGEEKGQETSVEVTFGYKRNADGKARIFLHHSSMPYKA
jgi:hypothetical protein